MLLVVYLCILFDVYLSNLCSTCLKEDAVHPIRGRACCAHRVRGQLPVHMASNEAVIPTDKPCVKLKWTRMLTMVALFGNTGMFLAGYTTAVQNNAMLPLAENFNLTTSQKEGITASTLLFAAPTSVLSSTLSTAFGRRPVLLMST